MVDDPLLGGGKGGFASKKVYIAPGPTAKPSEGTAQPMISLKTNRGGGNNGGDEL